ncbi:MAG: hypothetical protein Q4D62_14235 [Planctomycetia bacterium]|nr:hypothetical protein [Planctomycetia bacterium]
MANETVYSSGSVFIRAMLTDCNGDAVLPEAVSAIHLNVLEYLPPQEKVTAYYGKVIPLSAMLAEVQTDCDGETFNFEHNPYDGVNPIFPKRQTTYIVEVVWFDKNGLPSAHQVEVDAL